MPGFRSGNPLHILIAILVYGVFAIFALSVGLASFSSFSNFVVGATVLLGPVGCYLFAFGLFNIRTRCGAAVSPYEAISFLLRLRHAQLAAALLFL